MTVTKKDLIIKIADETGIKQVYVKKVVQRLMDHMIDALSEGRTIELRNFGVFKVKTRKGRIGRNPKTGEEVQIPEKRVVSFKSGMIMKQKVK